MTPPPQLPKKSPRHRTRAEQQMFWSIVMSVGNKESKRRAWDWYLYQLTPDN